MPTEPPSHATTPTLDDHRAKTAGERLRDLRERLGLSIRVAAGRAGVSHGTIQNIESNGLDGRSFEIVDRIARGYGVGLAELHRIARGLDASRGFATRAPEALPPRWVALPVHPLGDARGAPLDGEVAIVPRAHLARAGAGVDTACAFVLDGACLVGLEALRSERAFCAGDYLVVDPARAWEPGDVVAAWWPAEEKLVIERYAFERDGTVLLPVASGHAGLARPADDRLRIVGPVVWRGG